MTSIVKPAADTALVQLPALTRELLDEAIDKPLRLLPADWRPLVWNFWAKWSDLLRTQLSLAATLREWVEEDGLTLAELRAAFAALNRPSRRATMRFPGDVLAELALEVAQILAKRGQSERIAEMQQSERDAVEQALLDFPAVVAKLAEVRETIKCETRGEREARERANAEWLSAHSQPE